jgi:hypothetical protein
MEAQALTIERRFISNKKERNGMAASTLPSITANSLIQKL